MIIKNIRKNFFENINIKIDKSIWNKKEKVIPGWNIDKDIKFIYIDTTNIMNMIYTYLENNNSRVNVFSENKIKTISGLYNSEKGHNDKFSLDDLATFLWICSKDKPDYVIIQCNKSKLETISHYSLFDIKILNTLETDFIKNHECKTFVNLDNVMVDDIKEFENIKLFAVGPKKLNEKYFEKVRESKSSNNLILYPIDKKYSSDNTKLKYFIDGKYRIYEIKATTAQSCYLSTLFILILITIGQFDYFKSKYFLNNYDMEIIKNDKNN